MNDGWIARSTDSSFFGTLKLPSRQMFEKEQSYVIKQVDIWRSIVSVAEAWKCDQKLVSDACPYTGQDWGNGTSLGAALRCVGVERTLQPVSPASWTAQVHHRTHSVRRLSQSTGHCESAFVEWITGKWCLVYFLGFRDEAPQAG